MLQSCEHSSVFVYHLTTDLDKRWNGSELSETYFKATNNIQRLSTARKLEYA